MKKTTAVINLIFFVIILFGSCKKKENTSNSTNNNNSVPTSHINVMSAKVNNTNWVMANSQTNSASYISKFLSIYSFGGKNSFMSPYSSLEVSFTYTTGIYTLTNSFNNFTAQFKDSSNTYYTALTGTINITALDTISSSQGLISKFKATFSFSTDTINNKSYVISNGIVDFQKQN